MAQKQMHIAILCSRLDLPGGIERAVVNTANLFATHDKKVTLVILDEVNSSFYPVHPSVTIVQQSLSFGITPEGNVISRKIKLLTDVLKLRKLLKQLQPTLIIASEYPLAAATVLCGAKKYSKVISWEHHHFYELKRNLFWEKIFRLTYPRLDAVVCLNEDEKKLFGTINTTIFVIPNFVETTAIKSTVVNDLILTIGRLTEVKGIDLLLPIVKQVLKVHPGWQWKLIGDGEMKEDVVNFIEIEKLQNRFILQIPVSPDISEEYRNASVYVMTSRNECLPMTLLEAQSAGLPCIAFDCDTGPRHIIKQNENGLLVDKRNITAAVNAVSLLITNEEKRKQMGKMAVENSVRFSKEQVYLLWEKAFFISQ